MINSAPTPPAPTTPSTAEALKFISNLYSQYETTVGITWGITPNNSSLTFEPPDAFIASRGPSSIPSITSEDNLPSVPIEWIPTARVPVSGPKPVIGRKTNASISSGKALIIFNTCFVNLFNILKVTLFAARKEIGKLNSAPITVPAQAINSDSPTFGTILSIASLDKSRGNIAEINIQILLGASKNLSGVTSSPDADQIDAATIKIVNKYLRTFWEIGCFGMFKVSSF